MEQPTIIGDTFDMSIGNKRAVRTLLVRLPENKSGEYAEALRAAGIPAVSSTHPANPSLYAEEITVAPVHPGNRNEAKVTVVYGIPNPTSKEVYGQTAESVVDPATPPWERPVTYAFSSAKREITTDTYYTDAGTPLPNTNSAGDLFSPQMMRLEALRIITVKVAYPADAEPLWSDAFIGTVNSNMLELFGRSGRHCFFCDDADYELRYWHDPEQDLDIPYYQLKLVIQHNPDGFAVRQLDMGYRQRKEGIGLTVVTDTDENQPIRPVKLNGNGVALSWEDQADPNAFVLLEPRHFYRPVAWSIPRLTDTEDDG